jgi:recombination protein RecA
MGERIIGNRTKVKIVKNKVAAPFRTCEFDIMYNEGISIPGDLLDIGTELAIVTKSGNSYAFGSEKLGVGRENAKAALRERPDIMKQIREQSITAWQARETTNNTSAPPTPSVEDADEPVET